MVPWRIPCRLQSLVLAAATLLAASAAARAADTQQVHAARGIIREIAPDQRTAVIRHEAITDYMPAMTMEFNLRDTNELTGLRAGDAIAFRLTASGDTHWIDEVRKLAPAANNPLPQTPATTPPKPVQLKPGDVLPDYELLAEDGHRVRISDFRGKALAFTFIFTRCPLPDFCPRMGSNFAKARELLLAAGGSPTNWQFLSVSFDPDFDKPEVLGSYAGFYRAGNADRWIFAAAPDKVLTELAPRLDLLISRDAGGGISHNLRTVVLDPRGRIFREFVGNLWTPQQLADALLEAARVQTQS